MRHCLDVDAALKLEIPRAEGVGLGEVLIVQAGLRRDVARPDDDTSKFSDGGTSPAVSARSPTATVPAPSATLKAAILSRSRGTKAMVICGSSGSWAEAGEIRRGASAAAATARSRMRRSRRAVTPLMESSRPAGRAPALFTAIPHGSVVDGRIRRARVQTAT